MSKLACAGVLLGAVALLSAACGDEVAQPDEMQAHLFVNVYHGRSEALAFAQFRTFELELPPTETLEVQVNSVELAAYPDHESERPSARFHSEGIPVLEGAGAYTFVVRGDGGEPLRLSIPRVTPAEITSPADGVEVRLDTPLELTWSAGTADDIVENDNVTTRILGLHEPGGESPVIEKGATGATVSPKLLRSWYDAAIHTANLIARDEGGEPPLRDGEPIAMEIILSRHRMGHTSPTFASGGYVISEQVSAVSVTLVP